MNLLLDALVVEVSELIEVDIVDGGQMGILNVHGFDPFIVVGFELLSNLCLVE